jgi:hypothetical protein
MMHKIVLIILIIILIVIINGQKYGLDWQKYGLDGQKYGLDGQKYGLDWQKYGLDGQKYGLDGQKYDSFKGDGGDGIGRDGIGRGDGDIGRGDDKSEPVMPVIRALDNTSVIRGDTSIRYNPTITDSDLTYYENDTINQTNIVENAFNIVNMVDVIDYGKVKTGMDKCKQVCSGVCYEGGYTGSATCFPVKSNKFDYGTLYKNPMFINGIQDNYKEDEKYSYGGDI